MIMCSKCGDKSCCVKFQTCDECEELMCSKHVLGMCNGCGLESVCADCNKDCGCFQHSETNRAKEILIDLGDLEYNHFYSLSKEDQKKFLDDLTSMLPVGVKHGDIINTITQDKRDRNDGTFIYNGKTKKVMELESKPDDYGTVPKLFRVSMSDFSPKYWDGLIVHNNIFWVAPDDTIIASKTVKKNEDGYHVGTITLGHREYDFVVYSEEEKYEYTDDDLFMCHIVAGHWDHDPVYFIENEIYDKFQDSFEKMEKKYKNHLVVYPNTKL